MQRFTAPSMTQCARLSGQPDEPARSEVRIAHAGASGWCVARSAVYQVIMFWVADSVFRVSRMMRMIVFPAKQPAEVGICDEIFAEQIPDDEAAPPWVHRQFLEAAAAAPSLSGSSASTPGPRDDVPQAGSFDPSAPDLIHAELRRSGSAMHRVRCWRDGETLVLSGVTTRYYYVQIALTTALRHAGCCRIVNRIEVVPPSPRAVIGDGGPSHVTSSSVGVPSFHQLPKCQ